LHIVDTFERGFFLTACELKRQAVVKRLHIRGFEAVSRLLSAAVTHHGHRKLKHEQLVKDKAFFCKLKAVKVLWEMDIVYRIFLGTKLVFAPDALRQRFKDELPALCKRAAYRLSQHMLGKPFGEAVYGLQLFGGIARENQR
jgi:hypothetical protein